MTSPNPPASTRRLPRRLAAGLLVLLAAIPAAHAVQSQRMVFEDLGFRVIRVDLRSDNLELHWKDGSGQPFGDIVRNRQRPLTAFIERRLEEAFVPDVKPPMCVSGRVLKHIRRSRTGIERFAFLDPNRLDLVDHGLVAFEPRLPLDEAVERLEKADVVGDRAVECNVDHVDEGRRRRSGRRRAGC